MVHDDLASGVVMPSTDEKIGMLIEAVDNLKTTVERVSGKVDVLHDAEQRRSGAMKVLAVAAGSIGAIVSFVIGKLWP